MGAGNMTKQETKRRALVPAIDINGTFGDTVTGLTPRFPAHRTKMESGAVLEAVADRTNKKITPTEEKSEETGAPK
ncbi:MAG: hypothetical protein IIB00_03360 [candidate division Zixibacteria bacterium]|nr:hypothetical protein [candidate division Zixibacteria bacterium]